MYPSLRAVFRSLVIWVLVVALLLGTSPVSAAPATRAAAQGSAGCAYYSYSLPIWSALRLQSSSQTVLLWGSIANNKVHVVIDGVDYGDYALPLNLGSIAVAMDYRAHLSSYMGQVRVVTRHKPRVDACVSWAADIVSTGSASSAGLSSYGPLPEVGVDEGGRLPATGMQRAAPVLPAPAAVAPFFTPQTGPAAESPLAPSPGQGAVAAAAGGFSSAQVKTLSALAVDRGDQATDVLAAAPEATASWYVFEPYNYNNYYRSLTSYSNFNYLNLWRGWNINQILGYTDRFINRISRNPYIWRSLQASAAGENSALDAGTMLPMGLMALSGIRGAQGNWNQFEGQSPYPDFGGGQEQSSQSSLVTAAILGYETSQARNFGTQYQAGLNTLLSPWVAYAPWLTRPGDDSVAASAADASSGPFYARYEAIGQMQAGTYSTNGQLSDLRSESNRVSIGLIYLDPYYIYYMLELNRVWQEIFTTRPSYAQWLAVQQEIASWTDVPEDAATLKYRYQKRQELNQWYYVVYYESLLYLAQPENLATLQWIVEVYAYLQSLVTNLWSSEWAAQWYSQWLQDWDDTHQDVMASSGVQPAMEKLLKDEPAFTEYLQLNREVIDLMSTEFANHAAVQAVSEETAAVVQDNDVSQAVNEAYTEYNSELNELLEKTDFEAELEHFTAEVNTSESQNLTYDQLVLRYEQVGTAFNDYQLRMYKAVADCFKANGTACDAYNDAAVTAILADPATIETLRAVGDFYEAARLYWYSYYTGSEYGQVETVATAAMQNTVATVKDQIDTARTSFVAAVYDIPKVNDLYRNSLDMLATIRGKGTGNASDTVNASAAAELDAKLSRMSELVVLLEPNARLYLPVVTR